MLDIKHIIEHIDEYKKSILDRNMAVDMSNLVRYHADRVSVQKEMEQLQQQRNTVAKQSGQTSNETIRAQFIAVGKSLKVQIAALEKRHAEIDNALTSLAKQVPNIYHPDAPIGKEEKDNLVIRTYKEPTQFNFTPKDHMVLAETLDIVDFDTAADVTGTKFYYLKNQAVILELALLRFGIDILQKHGFTILQTPDLARIDMIDKIGFNPRGPESNIYQITGSDLGLIGTAEITLGGYYANRVLSQEDLPIKIAGISHCFRKESGAAGQYSKGLYRVHQFTKLEMFLFCTPEASEHTHQSLLGIEEEIYQSLGIPYRIVDTCTGDLGAPAYRKYDIEAWMPGRGENGGYGEITSASNCTDYQARRLKIRYQNEHKQRVFPHMLNGTAIAISRTLVAILENYQNKDGTVNIPTSLVPYCGFDTIINQKPKQHATTTVKTQ